MLCSSDRMYDGIESLLCSYHTMTVVRWLQLPWFGFSRSTPIQSHDVMCRTQ